MTYFLSSLACHLRYALILMICIVILVLLSKWTGTGGAPQWMVKQVYPSTPPNANVTPAHAAAAANQVRQAQQWMDKSVLTQNNQEALSTATYALGYLDAALDLVQDDFDMLQKAVGDEINVEELDHSLRERQTQLNEVQSYSSQQQPQPQLPTPISNHTYSNSHSSNFNFNLPQSEYVNPNLMVGVTPFPFQ